MTRRNLVIQQLLLFICIPIISLGQLLIPDIPVIEFGFKYENQFNLKREHFDKNHLFYNNPINDKLTNHFIGIVAGVDLKPIKCRITTDILFNTSPSYQENIEEYFPLFTGYLVDDGAGGFDQVGQHDAYTLSAVGRIENNLKLNFNVAYNLITNFHITASLGFRKFKSYGMWEEWVEDVPVFDAASGGLVLFDMILQSRIEEEWSEYSFNMGISYEIQRLVIECKVPISVNTPDYSGTMVHPGGGALQAAQVTTLSGEPTIKNTGILFSLSYLIF